MLQLLYEIAVQKLLGKVGFMKIIVASDTHGDSNRLIEVLSKNKDFDMLIHLGDGENDFRDVEMLYPTKGLVYVAGNCDYGFHPEEHIAIAGGKKIFCCHGHRYGVNYGIELLASAAVKNECSIALYGHTHVPKIETLDGVMVMNPGSLTLPRGGSERSFGIIEISKSGEADVKIVPFGKW